MIVISGVDGLFSKYKELPDVGWLYVDDSFSLESLNDINKGVYYLAENEDEEINFEENYGTFLEAPTFKAIIDNKLEHHPNASKEELLEAVIYYLEEDDFLD